MKFQSISTCVFVFASFGLVGCFDNGGIDPNADAGGTGGAGGAAICGPVCDIHCEHGNVLDDKGCPTCSCNPGPIECPADACASPPPVALLCPGSNTPVGFSCQRGKGGTCELVQDECPACALVDCANTCPSGFVTDENGCQTCECLPVDTCRRDNCGPVPPVAPCPNGQGPSMDCVATNSGMCAWKIGQCSMCGDVLCAIHCPFGNKTDANGCQTCTCNPAPACEPKECGPAPGAPIQICDDGSVAGPVCERNVSGKCTWRFDLCPAPCSDARDLKACESAKRCQWLEPGCSGNRLPVAGCFPRSSVNCELGQTCNNGKTCVSRTVDHCAGRPELRCFTCSSPTNICL